MHRSAFTLVELSIVLVILGLLIGGVLTGQSLIRAAELRSITTQYSRFITAGQTFRDKYMALPGDITNATSYWGAADGSTGMTAGCATTASTTPVTCNGNGDGRIGIITGSNETFRFWQHLANAGLIEGSYSGIQQGTANISATAVNSPVGRISSSLWSVQNWGPISSNTTVFDGIYDNFLMVGGIIAESDPYNGILKPEDAYNIDTKIDDGKPAAGRMVARQAGGWSATAGCSDATSGASLTANYLLTNTALKCALMWKQAF